MAEQLISEAVQGRKTSGILERVARFDQYYEGNHKVRMRDKRKGNSVRNKIAEIVENRIAQLTDAPPKWIFRAQEEGDVFTSDMLNQFLGDIVWDKIGWSERGEDAIMEAAAAGTCHIKTIVNVNDGYPDFVIMPAESFAPDPHARTKKRLRYWIHFIVKGLDEIKRDYDVDLAAEAIRTPQEGTGSFFRPEITYQASTANTAPSQVWNLLDRGVGRTIDAPDMMKRAVIAEIWMQDLADEVTPFNISEVQDEHAKLARGILPRVDPTMNHERHLREHAKTIRELSSDATNNNLIEAIERHTRDHERFSPNAKRAKYPRGRVITISQGKILEDRPNPLPLDFRDVLIKFDYGKQRNAYQGIPLCHNLYDLQDDLNHRRNSITMNINMLNNGIRTFKQSIFKKFSKVSNIIGLNVPVREHDDFKATFGPALPQHIVQDRLILEEEMEKQSGNNDIQQGRFPTGSPAGVTVARLDEKGSVRIRLALRHYAGALKDMGRNAIAIMGEFLDPSELFRFVGSDNMAQQFRWQDIRDQAAFKDIRVDVGSMDSTSRLSKLRLALELKAADIYDDVAVLESLDDPRKYGVLQRKSQLLAMAQALQSSEFENDALRKQLNTVLNRAQGEGGAGNVGVLPSGN